MRRSVSLFLAVTISLVIWAYPTTSPSKTPPNLANAPVTVIQAPTAITNGTAYVTFWRGDLRIFATEPNTKVTLIDINTGVLLNMAGISDNFGNANPFVLSGVGAAERHDGRVEALE